MAYRVYFDEKGKAYIETDSPEEAIRIAQSSSMRSVTAPQSAPTPKIEQPLRFPREVDPAALKRAFDEMNDNAKRFLLNLTAFPKGLRGESLGTSTGLAVEKFGGIMGGASKILKKHGFSLDNLVDSKQIVRGTERYRMIKPTSILLDNAEFLRAGTNQVGLLGVGR